MATTSKLIRKLKRDLAGLRRIPETNREAELADVREEICRSMLADLMAGRPLQRSPAADHVRG